MNKQIPLDGFQNVVGSGVATCDLNKFLGSVIEKITLTLGGTFTKSMIIYAAIRANGKIIWESDGTKLDTSNQYFTQNGDVTILKIDFMDRLALTSNAKQSGTIDLSAESGITQVRLEVTISGATSPTLKGFADLMPPDASEAEKGIRFLMARRHRATQVIGAAGQFVLQVPHIDPASGGSNYRRIYFYSANMTALKGVREGINEFEITKLENEASQKDNKRVPQANLFVFDPVQDGFMAGRTWDTRPAVGVRSAQLLGTFSAGETITIETEELIPFRAY